MTYKAVITGDIVHSREVENMHALLNVLKSTISEIKKVFSTKINFEIYRGDSFQMLVAQPEEAMKIALLIRSKLRSSVLISAKNDANVSLESLWDARISIGIGKVSNQSQRVVESTGEAFELSGRQLDEMKNKHERLCITTCWKNMNLQLQVITKLSDAIVSRWTLNSSEAAYRHLLFNETQAEIAKKLNVSQPAVHKRLIIANMEAIKEMLDYLNLTIKNQIHGI